MMKKDRLKMILNGAKRLMAMSTIVLTGCLASPLARADTPCAILLSPGQISFDTVQVPDDLPVGGMIKMISLVVYVACTSAPDDPVLRISGIHLSPSGIAGVFETGVAGIGFQPNALSREANNEWFSNQNLTVGVNTISQRVALVKTSENVAAAGIIEIPNLLKFFVGDSVRWLSLTATKIGKPTCNAVNSVNVSLPPISIKALRVQGSTAGTTPFSIVLTCSEDSALYVTMTDMVTPENLSDTLTLSPLSTAQGVQFRISKQDGTLVSFGPDSPFAGNARQWYVGTTKKGTVTIPMSVQYISTGTVTPGFVRGVMSFTLSYQ